MVQPDHDVVARVYLRLRREITAATRVRICLHVMAGPVPAIHGFPSCWRRRRGWPAFAGHDVEKDASRPDDSFISRRALSETPMACEAAGLVPRHVAPI